MSIKRFAAIVMALALAVLMADSAAGVGRRYVRVGVLECIVAPGIGLLVISSKSLACTFSPSSGAPERYSGRINKVGVDIGVTGKSVIIWAVFAAQSGYKPGSLAGTYVGISAQASVGTRRRRQCADRRVQPLDRAAAAQRPGADRPQPRGRSDRAQPRPPLGRVRVAPAQPRLRRRSAAGFYCRMLVMNVFP